METAVALSGTNFDSLLSWTKEDMQTAWGTAYHKNHGERKQILQIYCVLKRRVCNPDALGVGAAEVVSMGFIQMKRWSTNHFKTSNWEECARVTCLE